MGTMESQINSLSNVYPAFYSGAYQRKHESSASLAFGAWISPVTGELPVQMASYAENVSIWWSHHVSIRIPLKFVSKGPIDDKSNLVQVMACR